MDHLITVDSVLGVVSGLIIHGRLELVEAKLAVFTDLKVLNGGLLVEKGDNHGSPLDFRGNALIVES